MKSVLLGYCLAVIGFAAAIGAGENKGMVAASDLVGGKFILQMVDGKAFSGAKPVFVEFGDDLAMNGSVCNVFRSQATLAEGKLKTGPIMASRMMCPDNDLSLLEARFLRVLEQGVTLLLSGNCLTMCLDDGSLVFEKAISTVQPEVAAKDGGPDPVTEDALLGKKFVLIKVGGEDFASERQPFIAFSKENDEFRTYGAACNNFTGAAELQDGKLTIKAAATTMMMCEDEKLGAFERIFHQLLQTGAIITLDSGTLSLSADGVMLQYVAE